MRVCIARNAEARTNAAIARVANALNDGGHDPCLLTRNRFIYGCGRVRKLKYSLTDKEIINYEIVLKSEPGRGFVNISTAVISMHSVYMVYGKSR